MLVPTGLIQPTHGSRFPLMVPSCATRDADWAGGRIIRRCLNVWNRTKVLWADDLVRHLDAVSTRI